MVHTKSNLRFCCMKSIFVWSLVYTKNIYLCIDTYVERMGMVNVHLKSLTLLHIAMMRLEGWGRSHVHVRRLEINVTYFTINYNLHFITELITNIFNHFRSKKKDEVFYKESSSLGLYPLDSEYLKYKLHLSVD